ncbi:alanine racemase [Aeromicrobium piscarium]|uniref:Alanine racemase n=1 Tax=Aeromicrobium piscarium TaxID=2590901 RepID=A0A554S911_9ACTN|nr:alanine racemase [Aeromicrobium piscarium]TSD62834.1 alanine racemase [Aeromicrobium piscarium]
MSPLPAPQASAEALIDLEAYRENLLRIGHLVGSAELMAVLKADAYGHGMEACARVLPEAGVTSAGVATPAEALTLRRSMAEGSVMCWLTTPADDLAPAIAAGVELSASGIAELDQLADAAGRAGRRASVHLKIDTGMSRAGAPLGLWRDLVRGALSWQDRGRIEVVGIWTHLACADDPTDPRTDRQAVVFDEAVAEARELGADPRWTHLANSAAALSRPDLRRDLVRVGLASYGVSPQPEHRSAASWGLRPVMTVRAVVAQVKRLAAGDHVSYGNSWRADRPTTVALVPVGYADGIPRQLSNRGRAALRGRVHRIIGRVCMDQLVLDLGDSTAERGDVVTLFGAGEAAPSAQEWADAADTIGYDIVSGVRGRIVRRQLG